MNDNPLPMTLARYSAVRYKIAFIHVAFWAIFVIVEHTVLSASGAKMLPVWHYAIYYGINLALFYSQLWLFNLPTRLPIYILLKLVAFAGILAAYLALKYTADVLLAPPGHWQKFLANTLYRGWYFIFLAGFYWLAGRLSDYARRVAQAEKTAAEAHVAYLQQQVNPHLLLNSLNFIYTSVNKYSEEGARCVELLAEIMRFCLAKTGADGKVDLPDELEQLTNLVEINAYRFQEPLQFEFKATGNPEGRRIIPLILLTLTENIFKHGHLQDPASPALLELTIEDSQLIFHSRNRKKRSRLDERISHIGLQNARIRLDYAYEKNYTLTINETTAIYDLTLNLPL